MRLPRASPPPCPAENEKLETRNPIGQLPRWPDSSTRVVAITSPVDLRASIRSPPLRYPSVQLTEIVGNTTVRVPTRRETGERPPAGRCATAEKGNAVVPDNPIDQRASAPTTRRKVIKTGIKLAYVTPIVAAVVQTTRSADANGVIVSPPDVINTPAPTATPTCVANFLPCSPPGGPPCCSDLCFEAMCIPLPVDD